MLTRPHLHGQSLFLWQLNFTMTIISLYVLALDPQTNFLSEKFIPLDIEVTN